jgi:arsenate reductase (glutaredoxin)
LAWLRSRGVELETIDIVMSPPSARELARIATLAERPPAKMFNTSGESYRAGGFKDRVASMKPAEVFAALAADGKLVKRPLLVSEDFALVGFDESAWAARFAAQR